MQDGLFSLFSVFSVGKKKIRFHPRISLLIKVFKPGLVTDPGHRVLTESDGSISILKKIQNGVILVKKQNKSQRDATRFLTRFCRVNRPGHTES